MGSKIDIFSLKAQKILKYCDVITYWIIEKFHYQRHISAQLG